jgi:outer membrane receptor protein involved in Fe transport
VTGDPATGPCVDSYTLVDLTAGYRLPITGATLQLNITNLFDEKYQSFVGTPEIGRMAILRLKYDL